MKRYFKSAISMVFALLLVITLPLTAQEKKESKAKETPSIEARVDKLFKDYDTIDSPGASVAVVKDGMVVYRKGFGSAQLEYNIPITPSTVFHVASVSKQFTAMAALMLEAQGKLSLDDDIRKHLPWVPDMGKKITIRHLVHHTSGLRDQWSLLVMGGWRIDDIITQDHIIDLVKRMKELNFEPGAQYMYCNTGYTLMAEIVSAASGKPFEQWCDENIFKPLGMTSTHFHKEVDMIVKNRAYSYDRNDKKEFVKSLLNYSNVGATSLFTTVEDLVNWMRNFDEKRLADEKVMKRFLTKGVLNDGKEIEYACGISVSEYKGLPTYSHGGGDAGFRSYLLYFPAQKLGVTVLSNYANFNVRRVTEQIADIYLDGKLKTAAPAAAAAKTAEKKRKAIKISARKLKTFTGTYWLERAKLLRKIAVEKGKLYYVRDTGRRSELAPVSITTFKMKEFPAVTVAFSDNRGTHYGSITLNVPNSPPLKGKWTPPFDPAKLKLNEYIGTYYSEELDFYYHLKLEKGKLYVRSRNADSDPLKALIKDNFSYYGGYATIKFQRDGNGGITGFFLNTPRVLNLRFKKQKPE
jgi:CubicO group peptidase (beta-lactamase class C family)